MPRFIPDDVHPAEEARQDALADARADGPPHPCRECNGAGCPACWDTWDDQDDPDD